MKISPVVKSKDVVSMSRFFKDLTDGKVEPLPEPTSRPPVYDTNFWGRPRLIDMGDPPPGSWWVNRKFARKLKELDDYWKPGRRHPRRLSKRQRQLQAMRRARNRG